MKAGIFLICLKVKEWWLPQKPQQLLAHITSCCLRYIDAFTELKRGNMCSQREVGNSNIQMTAELNLTDISGLQIFIRVNDFY